MDIRELAKEVIIDKGGIAKSADFVAAGMRAVDVVNMCNAGYLDRVRHGYYQLAGQDTSSEEQLLATLIPQGIVCVESALFHYGYSDFCTSQVVNSCSPIYVKNKAGTGCSCSTDLLCSARALRAGKTKDDFNGVTLPVYDRERTICDCFKYRSRLDNELFNKALNAYANDTKKNLQNLSVYAKKLRVYKKVTELMEVLLNG